MSIDNGIRPEHTTTDVVGLRELVLLSFRIDHDRSGSRELAVDRDGLIRRLGRGPRAYTHEQLALAAGLPVAHVERILA
ncbi:hypothetical protein HQQ80_16625 [Microbacteriaceae bacterium VKM Ac-2855]|nr:hypothetical protein [Microbacteriaceae bacterium VKM Ac-2855]